MTAAVHRRVRRQRIAVDGDARCFGREYPTATHIAPTSSPDGRTNAHHGGTGQPRADNTTTSTATANPEAPNFAGTVQACSVRLRRLGDTRSLSCGVGRHDRALTAATSTRPSAARMAQTPGWPRRWCRTVRFPAATDPFVGVRGAHAGDHELLADVHARRTQVQHLIASRGSGHCSPP